MSSIVLRTPDCVLFHQDLTIDFVLKTTFKSQYSTFLTQSQVTLFEKIVITDNQRNESVEYFPRSDYGGAYYGNNRNTEIVAFNYLVQYNLPQSLRQDISNDPYQDYTARESGYGISSVGIYAGYATSLPTVCKGIITNLIHSDGTIESSKRFIKPRIALPKTKTVLGADLFYREGSDCTFYYKGTLNPREIHVSGFSLPAIPSVTDIFKVFSVESPEPYTSSEE